MDARDMALVLAGAIGGGVAIVHGVLVHRAVVGPLAAQPVRMGGVARRIVTPLLQFSTFAWLVGGVALVAAPRFGNEARHVTVVLVGSSYLYGTVANLWASRGRHPGWVAYAVALTLIGFGGLT